MALADYINSKPTIEKVVDGSEYSQYPVSKDAGKVRLQAGRSDPTGENGEYLV